MTNHNISLLEQALDLLTRIDDQMYVATPHAVTKSGIGGHIRHCLDFYQCFLRGLPTGRIDYDHRVRDELLEKDRRAAMTKIKITIRQLRALPIADESSPVQVKMEGEEYWSDSSTQRELQFLLSHTVHHYALVAMLLRLQGVEPTYGFGVAPSTLAYWQKAA